MLVRSPSTVRIGWISTPGLSSGTRNMVRLWCLGASGSVFVTRKTYCALWAFEVNILEPLMIQTPFPEPSRTARVLHVATSDPPSGSVYPRQSRNLPGQRARKHLIPELGRAEL